MLKTSRHVYALCAEPRDRDFPYRSRDCSGRILLDDSLDEDGDEYRCTECERPAYPARHGKLRHVEHRVTLLPQGVVGHLRSQLSKIDGATVEEAPGVYRLSLGGTLVYACLVDLCHEPRFLAHEWARLNRVCYIVADTNHATRRFLPEPWLTTVTFAELLTDADQLRRLLRSLTETSLPATVVAASVPVYSRVVPPIVPRAPAAATRRQFIVEVAERTVAVNGHVVMGPNASSRMRAFRYLWSAFLEDLASGRDPDEFRLHPITAIVKAMEKGATDAMDPAVVQRTVNRIRTDIAGEVRNAVGTPIGDQDIVESVAMPGARAGVHGYRINPRTVCPRPALEVRKN